MSARYKRLRRAQKRRQFKYQNGICCWCEQPMVLRTATWEHIIPVSLGGPDARSNRVLAHAHCNNLRGNRTDVIPAFAPYPVFTVGAS